LHHGAVQRWPNTPREKGVTRGRGTIIPGGVAAQRGGSLRGRAVWGAGGRFAGGQAKDNKLAANLAVGGKKSPLKLTTRASEKKIPASRWKF